MDYVQLFPKCGTDPSIVTNFPCAPQHWASLHGHTECIRLLLDAGADGSPFSGKGLSAKVFLTFDLPLGQPLPFGQYIYVYIYVYSSAIGQKEQALFTTSLTSETLHQAKLELDSRTGVQTFWSIRSRPQNPFRSTYSFTMNVKNKIIRI